MKSQLSLLKEANRKLFLENKNLLQKCNSLEEKLSLTERALNQEQAKSEELFNLNKELQQNVINHFKLFEGEFSFAFIYLI